MSTTVSRRAFLKMTGVAGGTMLLAGCGFIDSIRGIPETGLPQIENAWSYDGSTLSLDLSRLPEIQSLGGAVRIEGEALPAPILIVLGENGEYYAFKNACTHGGRMIDPVAGTMTLQCCSASKSTYDYDGNVISGPAQGPLTSFPLTLDGSYLLIEV
ncbi:MAG: Rieske (2Fe-2S) protein [Anaerolineales bacterium]|nr:Rieske (2Fe-2S) protein [Anaerolineales bacterium]